MMRWIPPLSATVDRLPARLAIPVRARAGHQDVEIALLSQFVHRGDTVVDVGAHKGAYSWHLARLVGRDGTVHAFEPQPDLAARLRVALPARVQVYRCGLSDRQATTRLRVPVWGDTVMQGHASLEPETDDNTSTLHVDVTTIKLDDLGLAPTFLKIDVEGHEHAMLRGAAETIQRCAPTILIEIDFRHRQEDGTRRRVLDWLSERGYAAHYVDQHGALVPFEGLSADSDPNEKIAGPTYVYNWFMLPSPSHHREPLA